MGDNPAAKERDPVVPLNSPDSAPASSPVRKRKRRVPSAGASEDCHVCRKRNVQCDRRRPYCSQCLESNTDCPGYRTTLTWGVGVASRGKLRGMATPILNADTASPSNTSDHKLASSTSSITRRLSPAEQKEADQQRKKRARLTPLNTGKANSRSRDSGPRTAVIGGAYSNLPIDFQWQQREFQDAPNSGFQTFDPASTTYPNRHTDLFPLHTSIGTHFPDIPWANESPRTGSAQTEHAHFYHPEFQGDLGFSYTAPISQATSGAHFAPPYLPSPHTMAMPQYAYVDGFDQAAMAPALDGTQIGREDVEGHEARFVSADPPHSTSESQLDRMPHPDLAPQQEDVFRAFVPPTPNQAAGDEEHDVTQYHVDPGHNALIRLSPRPPDPFAIGPRMHYLIDYYDKNICPVIVAFDNENNPYRRYIIPLAFENPALQHALAALSTNNIRMRSLGQLPRRGLTGEEARDIVTKAAGPPTSEEQFYKAKSIELLNSQLANSTKSRDDSVMATLLVLCLFHVSDSGFSKFKTQLAGVQKLLRMRGKSNENDFISWVEMFFAWFDVMTAAVNDRETQIQGDTIDLMDLTNNLGPLEQFSGCEGRLFKLIARLGRLNLLSQGRAVKELPDQSPSHSPNNSQAPPENLPASRFVTQDNATTMPPLQPAVGVLDTLDDDRDPAFWIEWRQIRDRLQAWQFEHRFSPMTNSVPNPDPQHAMLHISETFRYAALLYTERLACPSVPSNSFNLQNLVSQALVHIEEIGEQSCMLKFMLWPLFIVGTECVTDQHRGLIRDRCAAIHRESGFYNNVFGLEVLERVWRGNNNDDDNDEEPQSQQQHQQQERRAQGQSQLKQSGRRGKANERCSVQAFRWRKCMDRVDGEYIVI